MELADQIGVSYSMLVRLELGDIQEPHPDLLRKVSDGLSMDYSALLELAGYLPPSIMAEAKASVQIIDAAFGVSGSVPNAAELWMTGKSSTITVERHHPEAVFGIRLIQTYWPFVMERGDIVWVGKYDPAQVGERSTFLSHSETQKIETPNPKKARKRGRPPIQPPPPPTPYINPLRAIAVIDTKIELIQLVTGSTQWVHPMTGMRVNVTDDMIAGRWIGRSF